MLEFRRKLKLHIAGNYIFLDVMRLCYKKTFKFRNFLFLFPFYELLKFIQCS